MYVYVVYLYDMYDSNIYLYNSNNFNNITTIIKKCKYTDIIYTYGFYYNNCCNSTANLAPPASGAVAITMSEI